MEEQKAVKERRKEIADQVVTLFARYKLSVYEATTILELTKITIDNSTIIAAGNGDGTTAESSEKSTESSPAKRLGLQPTLEVREVAEYLNVGVRTVLNRLRAGELKGYKQGIYWRIKREWLLEYEASLIGEVQAEGSEESCRSATIIPHPSRYTIAGN